MKSYLHLASVILLAAMFTSCSFFGSKNGDIKLFPVKSGELYQYIDTDGKIIINPQFRNASVFRNGLALVQTSDNEPKWGFITEDGKFTIMAKYKDATIFSEDLAWVVSENAAPTAINKNGEVKVTLQNAYSVRIFKDGLAAFSVRDSTGFKWGFIDKEGKIIINPQFSRTGDFSGGKCAVANPEGKWGYIDNTGKILINYQFDAAKDFVSGRAVVFTSNKAGVIDSDGKYVINPQFSDMTTDGDKFLIAQDNKYGWCDKDGKILVNPQFEDAYPFNGSELTAVQSGKNACYVDADGKIVINPQFDRALPFSGKLAVVSSNNKIGFIDKKGKYVINPQYDGITHDIFEYTVRGKSDYEIVTTDFFDVGAIVNRLKKDISENSVAGMNYSTPLSAVLIKYNKSLNDFLSTGSKVIGDEKISANAKLDMFVGFNGIQVNASPYIFVYNIYLGVDSGKSPAVLKAFETALTGYTKDQMNSNPELLVLQNNKQTVKIYGGGMVRITVEPSTIMAERIAIHKLDSIRRADSIASVRATL